MTDAERELWERFRGLLRELKALDRPFVSEYLRSAIMGLEAAVAHRRAAAQERKEQGAVFD